MSYADIDSIITTWVQRHTLTLYTRYQDSEVRSVDVIDSTGRKFQIWIDLPASGKVAVHAWDYQKRRKDWSAEKNDLGNCLENASATIMKWAMG